MDAQGYAAEGGAVVIPRGAVVHGTVTGLKSSGRVGDQAVIRLNFERITWEGNSYPFAAAVVETEIETEDAGDLEDVADEAGIGAAVGAALGAVLGGDLGDTLGGAALGAGAGTAISLGTGDVDATLPAGTDLMLRTTERIELR